MLTVIGCVQNLFRKFHCALAALSKAFGNAHLCAQSLAQFFDFAYFLIGIGKEFIDCHNHRNAVTLKVFDMRLKVAKTSFKTFCVRLRGILFFHAAVIFKRTSRCNKHNRRRLKPTETALDIKKLLRTEVRAEACLRHNIIPKLKRRFRGGQAVAAVGNICEGSAVDKAGRALKRLHKIRLDCVLKKRRHCAVSVQIAGGYGFPVKCSADYYL